VAVMDEAEPQERVWQRMTGDDDGVKALESHRHRMWNAITAWMIKLDDYPGWKDWRLKRVGRTLYFDDELLLHDEEEGV
jgi:hypothetical protein